MDEQQLTINNSSEMEGYADVQPCRTFSIQIQIQICLGWSGFCAPES